MAAKGKLTSAHIEDIIRGIGERGVDAKFYARKYRVNISTIHYHFNRSRDKFIDNKLFKGFVDDETETKMLQKSYKDYFKIKKCALEKVLDTGRTHE